MFKKNYLQYLREHSRILHAPLLIIIMNLKITFNQNHLLMFKKFKKVYFFLLKIFNEQNLKLNMSSET